MIVYFDFFSWHHCIGHQCRWFLLRLSLQHSHTSTSICYFKQMSVSFCSLNHMLAITQQYSFKYQNSCHFFVMLKDKNRENLFTFQRKSSELSFRFVCNYTTLAYWFMCVPYYTFEYDWQKKKLTLTDYSNCGPVPSHFCCGISAIILRCDPQRFDEVGAVHLWRS